MTRQRRCFLLECVALAGLVLVISLAISQIKHRNQSMSGEASARVIINIPREQAWAILSDLSQAHNYVPGIIRTEITTEKKEGVGASRKVYQSETKGLDETVVEWNEGYSFLFKLHRGEQGAPPPFKEAHFRYKLDDAGNNKTALTTSLIFTMRWGVLGDFLHRRLLSGVFRSTIRDVALSTKAYYESGQPTTPEKLKALKAELKEQAAH